MAFNLTQRAKAESEQLQITPNIILEIDGVTELYGATSIKKFVRIGDPGLVIGGFNVGGFIEVEDQSPYISLQGGTSTTIKQTLNIDKGKGESISSMKIAVVDKNGEITRDLLTPGATVTDILGRSAKVHLGFADSAFPEDYIVIFRGSITGADSSPGLVTFNINSPEDKARSEVFLKVDTELTASLSAGATVADVDSTTGFLEKVLGPDGVTIDPDMLTYIRVNDEIMEYQTISGTQFQSLSRGALGTVAASHGSGDGVESFVRLGPSNVIDVALKFLFSGREGPYLEDVAINNFVRVSPTETQANTLLFKEIDLVKEKGIVLGDYITTTGSANPGSNDVSNKTIGGITLDANGNTILTINGVSFVEENDSAATVDFRSQYDVWPEGAGIALAGDEVDTAEFLLQKQRFLSSPEVDFYIKDSVEGKEFLSEQILNPVSAFSLPRKSKISMGFHSPPIPGVDIKVLSGDNVKNASDLKLSRSTNKNFFNAIIYKFEEDPLEERFLRGFVTLDTDSTTRIPIGTKPLEIEAKGFRTLLSGENIASQAAARRLKKYRFAAEFVKGMKTNFRTAFDAEVGDIVVFDLASLKVSDIVSGTRAGEERLFQIDNKSLNLKTGEIIFDIVDTNFDKDSRFGLISPSSFVGPGATTTSFTIKPSFNTDRFGINEGNKWTKYIGAQIKVRTSDFVTEDTGILKSVVGNKITLESALSFTPSEDDIFELGLYTGNSERVQLVFVFMNDAAFPDGKVQYGMI